MNASFTFYADQMGSHIIVVPTRSFNKVVVLGFLLRYRPYGFYYDVASTVLFSAVSKAFTKSKVRRMSDWYF